MLGRLQLIGTTLSQVDLSITRGELDQAVGILDSAGEALAKLKGFEEIIVVGLMKQRCSDLRKLLVQRVDAAWGKLVDVGKDHVSIRDAAERMLPHVSLGHRLTRCSLRCQNTIGSGHHYFAVA